MVSIPSLNQLPTETEIVSYLNDYMRTLAFPELLRYLFKIVADGTITNLATGQTDILIETLEASQHAIYLPPSVNIQENTLFDAWQTAGVTTNGTTLAAGLHASILKRRQTFSPDVNEVYLHLSNSYSPIDISYRVWRVAGLSA